MSVFPVNGEHTDIPKDVVELMLRLQQHSSQDTAHVLNGLVKSFQRDLELTRAELRAVRNNVSAVCSQPWAPHPDVIRDQLYPSEQEIRKYLPEDWEN
jgi:hypothetical protein